MNLKAPEAATSGKPGREDSNLRPMGPASCQTALPRIAALEANQSDERKTYYVLAQVWANRPQAVTPGGRKSH